MMHRKFLLAIGLLVTLGGCSTPGSFLITPVPAEKKLEETVIHRDEGVLVRKRILVVDVDGVLMNSETGPMFGQKENPVSMFQEQLDKAAEDTLVKGVIVRINSPGGSIGASDVMHRQLLEFRKARPDVKVFAAITDVGASGGYYVACAAEKIYAQPSSLTGSIGVIFQTFSIERTLGMIGVDTLAIKSGPNKDMASPLHSRTPEEVKLLQAIIDQYYQKFLDVVLANRHNLTREKLTPLADGRVFTGTQAKQVGLVDDLLYLDEVIAELKKEAGLPLVKVVRYNRPLTYKPNIYSKADVPAPTAGPSTVNLINLGLSEVLGLHTPQFYYLWTGP